MQNNLKGAMAVIAVLGLLLGLSIGQHYRQYRQIKALERQLTTLPTSTSRPHCRLNEPNIIIIESDRNTVRHEHWEAQRAEIEAIKEKMRAEREAQLAELHRQIEQVREMWKRGD